MPETIERRISFNGGEISPWCDPRVDLDKYRASCREITNNRPSVYGGAFSRSGTLLVTPQANGSSVGRLIPFEFAADTTLILEFTDLEMRVITTGTNPSVIQFDPLNYTFWSTGMLYVRGTVRNVPLPSPDAGLWFCEVTHTSGTFTTDLANGYWSPATDFRVASPYTAAQLKDVQWYQQNDLIYLTHPQHKPQILSRLANNNWTMTSLVAEWPATRDENISTISIQTAGFTGTQPLTSSAPLFFPGMVGGRWIIIHRRLEPFEQVAVAAGPGSFSPALFVLGEWSCQVQAGSGTGTAWDVTAVVQRSYNKVTWETIRTITASRIEQSGLISGTELENCWLRVFIINESGSPPGGFFTIEAVDANHYGIVEITAYNTPQNVTCQIIFEPGDNSATTKWREDAWSSYRGFPRSVTIHEQRLMFGGNASQPQTVWGSIINDYYNFRSGAEDDLGLNFTMSGRKADAIQWLVSQDDLLIGTAGSEGPMGSRETDKAMTPSNVKVGRFTTIGSSFKQAIPAQDVVLYINRPGRKVYEIAFAFESDGYKSNDLTLLAEHIADSPVTQIALQKNPESILWCVTEAGQLLGLLYERAQNVSAWFRYVTDGTFESVAVVTGNGEEDQVWVTVLRDGTRYVERFQPDRIRMLKDGVQDTVCSSDCSVIYSGSPATVIAGLAHLNGKQVSVLADGATVSPYGPLDSLDWLTVSGGQITLPEEASTVIVGLPFQSTLEPSWLETNDPQTVSKVGKKRITRAIFDLWQSCGAEYSTNNGQSWFPIEFRDDGDDYDSHIPWRDGIAHMACEGEYVDQSSIIVRQRFPLPLNILSLHVRQTVNIEA